MAYHKNILPISASTGSAIDTHNVAACQTIERNAGVLRRPRSLVVTSDWSRVNCKRCLKLKPVAPSVPQNADQMTAALRASLKLKPAAPKRKALEVARQIHAHAMDAATAAQELVDALARGAKLDWEDLDCPTVKLASDITDSMELMEERMNWLDESEG